MAKVRIETLEPDILLVFFGGVLLLYGAMLLIGRAMGMGLSDRTVLALSATFSNRRRHRHSFRHLRLRRKGPAAVADDHQRQFAGPAHSLFAAAGDEGAGPHAHPPRQLGAQGC